MASRTGHFLSLHGLDRCLLLVLAAWIPCVLSKITTTTHSPHQLNLSTKPCSCPCRTWTSGNLLPSFEGAFMFIRLFSSFFSLSQSTYRSPDKRTLDKNTGRRWRARTAGHLISSFLDPGPSPLSFLISLYLLSTSLSFLFFDDKCLRGNNFLCLKRGVGLGGILAV